MRRNGNRKGHAANSAKDALKTTTNNKRKICSDPGCTEEAQKELIRYGCLCLRHWGHRVNSAHNIAMNTAAQELEDFQDEGGKLS